MLNMRTSPPESLSVFCCRLTVDVAHAEALEAVGEGAGEESPTVDDGDDRADADDDAQHGEQGAHLARPKAGKGHADVVKPLRPAPSLSEMMRPSRSVEDALALLGQLLAVGDEHDGHALAVQLVKDVHDGTAGGGVQRAGGSSARSSAGSFASARAMATRCFCPPESSFGSWLARSLMPTWASSSFAPLCPLAGGHPGIEQGQLHVFSARWCAR